jgi:hypothetical protein
MCDDGPYPDYRENAPEELADFREPSRVPNSASCPKNSLQTRIRRTNRCISLGPARTPEALFSVYEGRISPRQISGGRLRCDAMVGCDQVKRFWTTGHGLGFMSVTSDYVRLAGVKRPSASG